MWLNFFKKPTIIHSKKEQFSVINIKNQTSLCHKIDFFIFSVFFVQNLTA